MKKTIIAFAVALMIPVAMFADGYKSLWKQYDQACQKDLPQSQIHILDNISRQARHDRSYGNLLRAEVNRMTLYARLSADSLKPALQAMEERAVEAQGNDKALAAVYDCVLGDAYSKLLYKSDIKDCAAKSKAFYARALSCPDILACTKALGYEPFVKKGADGEIFNNDLLSIIGYKAKAYPLLNKYYDNAGNRRAALVTALDMLEDSNRDTGNYPYARSSSISRRYMQSLDSLIAIYGDLKECGEAALVRYRVMKRVSEISAAEKAEYIDYALRKWGAWRNISGLKNEYEQLVQPRLEATVNDVMLPGRADSVDVNARNVRNVVLAVTRLNLSGHTDLRPDNDSGWSRISKLLMPTTRVEISHRVDFVHEYDTNSFKMQMPALTPGLYLVEVYSDNKELKTQRTLVSVSDMFVAHLYLPQGKVRFAVLSATTGQPIPGAVIEAWYGNNKRTKLIADAEGEAIGTARASDYDQVRAYTATDNYMQKISAWGNFSNYSNKKHISMTQLFTDRAIYRPGQTVHVSALAYDIDGLHSTKTVNAKELTVTLYDSNSKMVEEKTVRTDAYGTASVDFTLPSRGMSGTFSVRSKGNSMGYKFFRVEEYKRPTFNVYFDEVSREYHNGDTVSVTGWAKTYSGVAVQNARVAYSVKRTQARLLFSYIDNADIDKVMLTDTVTTDTDGRFELRLPVVMPDGYEEASSVGGAAPRICPALFCNFTADVQVTDNAGESHSAETTLKLGTRATAFSFDMPDKVLKDSVLCVMFKRFNASGKALDGNVKYWFDNSSRSYDAAANETVKLRWSDIRELESGRHTLNVVCGADTVSREFVLFGIDDKCPAADTPDWAYISAQAFPRDGSPVYVQVGSSCENTRILYSVISGDKVIDSGHYDVSNAVKTIPYIYKEEYGEGLLINYLWVKDGVAYTHKYTIARPLENKTLNLKWITFRDKLTPGQKETWTLNITRPDMKDFINRRHADEESNFQLLALMYDKSLDQIMKNSFSFSLPLMQNLPSSRWSAATRVPWMLVAAKNITPAKEIPFRFNEFDYELNDLLYSSFGDMAIGAYPEAAISRPLYIRGYGTTLKASLGKSTQTAESTAAGSDAVYKTNSTSNVSSSDAEAPRDAEKDMTERESDVPLTQIRENLQETAFFYPAMYADNNGNVNISFTLPESVTTWKFHGFAHDKDVNFGMIDGEVVASKKVMVMPNVPRFVRTGDHAVISARISNTTADVISPSVQMHMIDPVTDKVVYSVTKKLKIGANETGSVSFDYSPDDANQLLICRIVAEGKGYSDGEQHYLPVLPNVERIINTVPFTLLKKGEKNIALNTLFPENSVGKRLTVEYTANPAWLLVQSLPYISQTDEKNAISLVSAYYANMIGRYLMNQTPVIKKVVDLWKKELDGKNGSLMSVLSKNQELKTLVLEETPWVIDADKEAGYRQMLTTFFDESEMDYRLSSQYDALAKLQKPDGSWSWWQGMDGSPSMTAQVVETLARLKTMTGNSQADVMINNAMAYLGKVVAEEYRKIRKAENNGEPFYICDSHAIQYLYVNALLSRELTAGEKPMKDYLMSYLRKDRQRNIYAKALMAVVLSKDGKTEEAKEYVESIRQYTVEKPEMGRYFDTYRAGYSWFDYRIPTQTVAIEALKAVQPADTQTVDEMRLWLLQSKRTQGWDTPINTVNAVYAFLDGNCGELSADQTGNVTLSVDGRNIVLPKLSAGLGYVKTAVDVDRQNTLLVKKTNDSTSWGAVYAEFVQNTAEVSAETSGIKIVREVVGGKKQFVVGDRVTVRLTITADRDYDFVQVVDKRAACMEPVDQTSCYGWGYYRVTKDNATNFYFNRMSKGTHVVETDYYIDRCGTYTSGTCSVQCAYAPEFYGRTAGRVYNVEK